MGEEEIGIMMKRILYCILSVLALILSCEDKNPAVNFSYPGIIDKEYRFNIGRIIPITIGQSIEGDGDISRDGKFLLYSSNSAGGNFDIYLRSMTDITTVRLTSHPSRDTNPVISPDGRYLAFVSLREDPEGDIFVVKFKPADLIEKRRNSVSGIKTLDEDVENITVEKDPESGANRTIKDSCPVWSPDGKTIAYSSTNGGKSNIWTMNRDGSGKKRITSEGGDYPSFSPDGGSIVYISYRENPHGDIYTIDLKSGSDKRVTSGKGIKLYPSYTRNTESIIYSSIESDTNGNGSLDLQDRSVIRYLETVSGNTYRLTKKSDSSFKARWLPVLSTRDYQGVILYTDITGENINLNIIPDKGIIPKRLNAKLQYEMSDTYLEEYDDPEKYQMSLESVYNIFGNEKESMASAYVNRALKELLYYYKNTGEHGEEDGIRSILKKRRKEKDLYAGFILEMNEGGIRFRNSQEVFSFVKKYGSDKKALYFLPFALEDISESFAEKKDFSNAVEVLKYILKNHGDFVRATDIRMKTALYGDDLRRGALSEDGVFILTKGNINQRIALTKKLAEPFEGGSLTRVDAEKYLKNVLGLKAKYKDEKRIMSLLSYTVGQIYDTLGMVDRGKEQLLETVSLSHPNDITYYLANIKLGENEVKHGNFADGEKYYGAAVNRYNRRFKKKDFRSRLLWLVNWYSKNGSKSLTSGKYREASEIYEKLVNVVTLMHNKRLYPEIYREYAPSAHVLYIDSYVSWKGETSLSELEGEYEKKLDVFRMDFNRAAIYGLGYIYTKKALTLRNRVDDSGRPPLLDVFSYLRKGADQIDWALFIDDTFIEPYLLKSWIYQYVDLERKNIGDDAVSAAGEFFPTHLWEENLLILEKGLEVNDEKSDPDNEGNLYLNMANNYYLLLNYPRALKSYKMAEKFKKGFSSDMEEALFHFHLGYSLWQNGEMKEAEQHILKARSIYDSLSSGGDNRKYSSQYLTLYKYFALFSRYDGRYREAVNWYKLILKFADRNGLRIDRARYMQELAYCYMKTGDDENAKTYISLASDMLQKYPDDEREYNLRIKVLGIGSIPAYDLGEDSIVVGNNKIFYPLDTRSKKLLNCSMLEEIAVSEGDYKGAIGALREKIRLLGDISTEVAVDTKIRSMNNIGFYSFVMGNPVEAEKYFNQAGNLSVESGNLEGTKSSMMNLVNLYSVQIEENPGRSQDWHKKVSTLIARIEKYRKEYYEKRLAGEIESLKASAEASKEKVTQDQIDEVTEKVRAETVENYYTLDIASSILKFYLAEIVYAADPVHEGGKISAPEELYTANSSSFDLYRSALSRFETAIDEAEKSNRIELKTRLLINAAICYERTGELEKAYVALLDADTLAEKYRLSWLGINSSYRLGHFLTQHGNEVEKNDFLALADKYFSRTVERIEEFPTLYMSYPGRISGIYNDYINFLIKRNSAAKAFNVAERYSRVARIIYVNSISPEFSSEYDRRRYNRYFSKVRLQGEYRNRISALLIAGKDPASPEVSEIEEKIRLERESLSSLLERIKESGGRIFPFVEVGEVNRIKYPADIFRFHKTEDGIYFWKLLDGKLDSGYIKDDINKVFVTGSGRPQCIILSDEAVESVLRGELKPTEDRIFISSLDRISDSLKDESLIRSKIYTDISGLAGKLNKGVEVVEGKGKEIPDFSVIIDAAGSGIDLTPEYIFSMSASPALLIQAGVKPDYNSLLLLFESAYYAGTKRIIAVPEIDNDLIAGLAGNIYSRGNEIPEKVYFPMGYINMFNVKPDPGNIQTQQRELKLFRESMIRGDFARSSVHLENWRALSGDKDQALYIIYKWQIELLSGNAEKAFSIINEYKPLKDEDKLSAEVMRAYTYFYTGNLNRAREVLVGIKNGDLHDIKYLESLISLVSDGNMKGFDEISALKPDILKVIPLERLIVPAAEFLFSIGDGDGKKILTRLSGDAWLSERERLMIQIITGRKPEVGRSMRSDRIASLWTKSAGEERREEVMKLVLGKNGADEFSIIPLLQTVLKYDGRYPVADLIQFTGTAGIDTVISKAGFLESLIFLKSYDRVLSENGRYSEREGLLLKISALATRASMHSVKKENVLEMAMNYILLEDFEKSYRTALSAEEEFVPEDSSYVDMQLLRMNLYIKAGKYKEAETKGELLGRVKELPADRKYLFELQLSLLELNRLSRLKSASVSDAAKFEKLFTSVLSLARHNTAILDRNGYRELTSQIFDEFINYKMRTGQHRDAHYYNEVKKLLLASSRCGRNLFADSGSLDIKDLASALPDGTVYMSVSRNRGNIFVWSVDKKSKQAFIIEEGYNALKGVIFQDISKTAETGVSGPALNRAAVKLDPLFRITDNRKNVLISVDSDTENIPFEIIIENRAGKVRPSLMFVPSLLLTTDRGGSVERSVYVTGSDSSVASYLGLVALRESGIKTAGESSDGGMIHFSGRIDYDRKGRSFKTGESDIKGMKIREAFFFADTGSIGGAGITDFLLGMSGVGIRCSVTDSSPVQEVNRAVFVENFYRNASSGTSLSESFRSAVDTLKNGKYGDPSFWSGYRLNIFDLGILKEK